MRLLTLAFLVLWAAVAGGPADAQKLERANLIIDMIACDDAQRQRKFFKHMLIYGRQETEDLVYNLVKERKCVWLDAGYEAAIYTKNGEFQVCLEVMRFKDCMWVGEDDIE